VLLNGIVLLHEQGYRLLFSSAMLLSRQHCPGNKLPPGTLQQPAQTDTAAEVATVVTRRSFHNSFSPLQ
jgi:hypothetical protein